MPRCSGGLTSVLWQVGLEKNSHEYTATLKSMELFQITVMPFGLVNSPCTFSRKIGSILRNLQWVEPFVYMMILFQLVVPLGRVLSALKEFLTGFLQQT